MVPTGRGLADGAEPFSTRTDRSAEGRSNQTEVNPAGFITASAVVTAAEPQS